jgi:hypothetical protein
VLTTNTETPSRGRFVRITGHYCMNPRVCDGGLCRVRRIERAIGEACLVPGVVQGHYWCMGPPNMGTP